MSNRTATGILERPVNVKKGKHKPKETYATLPDGRRAWTMYKDGQISGYTVSRKGHTVRKIAVWQAMTAIAEATSEAEAQTALRRLGLSVFVLKKNEKEWVRWKTRKRLR